MSHYSIYNFLNFYSAHWHVGSSRIEKRGRAKYMHVGALHRPSFFICHCFNFCCHALKCHSFCQMETSSGEKDFSAMETQQWDKRSESRGKVQHHHPFEKILNNTILNQIGQNVKKERGGHIADVFTLSFFVRSSFSPFQEFSLFLEKILPPLSFICYSMLSPLMCYSGERVNVDFGCFSSFGQAKQYKTLNLAQFI